MRAMGTNIDYSTVAHQTIYHNITSGSGAETLVAASRAWQDVATRLQRIQEYVEQAVRGIGVAQQGAAAEAATQASMPLVPWVANAATVAGGLASRISTQADLFTHTRDSMPKPRAVADPTWNQDPVEWAADGLIDWLPGIQTDEEGARVQAQQEEQRARDLMIGSDEGAGTLRHGEPGVEFGRRPGDDAQRVGQIGGQLPLHRQPAPLEPLPGAAPPVEALLSGPFPSTRHLQVPVHQPQLEPVPGQQVLLGRQLQHPVPRRRRHR